MTVYKHRLNVSAGLYEASGRSASMLDMTIGEFTTAAVVFQAFADDNRFTQETTLLTPSGTELELPDPSGKEHRSSDKKLIQMTSRPQDYNKLVVRANRAGYPVTEQIRRAMRLSNFVVWYGSVPISSFRLAADKQPIEYNWH